MPFSDVTDALLDPEIAGTPFRVYRRTEVVGNDGISVVTVAAPVDALGSVTPTGQRSLVREDAYQDQALTIKIITTFRLRMAGRDDAGVSFQADLVEWPVGSSNRYVVKSLDDYSQFGVGFVSADCAVENLSPSTQLA